MNQQNIQLFLMSNQKKFDVSKIPTIQEKLEYIDDNDMSVITAADYKDPTTMLIISLFLGGLGIDRFMLGETGMGVLKLLTGGCLGVLTIIDWFNIMNKTREKNYEVFCNVSKIYTQKSENENIPVISSDGITDDVINTLMQYKGLLDDGIITQEEFDAKKKEILGGIKL